MAAATTWKYGTLKDRLPNGCTIFSAEAVALINAFKIIKVSKISKFVIFSDSLSCLQSIKNEDITNSFILEILEAYTECAAQGKEIILCWIPSHIGIDGNEEADRHAKEATLQDIRPMKVPYKDYIPEAKAYIKDRWQRTWNGVTDILTIITPTIGKRQANTSLSRREEIVVYRIRIGHTRLTHSYLMSKEDPPECVHCNVQLSITHILLECPSLTTIREKYITGETMQEIFEKNRDRNIIDYLKEIDIYQKI